MRGMLGPNVAAAPAALTSTGATVRSQEAAWQAATYSALPDQSTPISWSKELAVYARPSLPRSILDLATSVLPYLALWVAMYFSLRVSYLLTLALAVPAAGFLLRTYIMFHDCAHGSFLPSRRGNRYLGTVLGLFVMTPFHCWRHNHAVHHATAADLDRRGQGDVPTLTVAEYVGRDRRGRFGYRLFRNPLVMFGLGPLFAMIIGPRIVTSSARPAQRRSIHATNITLAIVVAGLCLLVGWREYLLIQGPAAMLAGSAGIWLFYVQHQFEDTYWERGGDWTYSDAGLRGSSFLKLPQPLQWFTGNIGFHHVHHLCALIPNYNLQRAHEENDVFASVPTITFWDGLRATRLKLWDEDQRRLVTFAEARASVRVAPAAAAHAATS
jgi:omega-6 fatty acid desaturase (delta-12 desaturase)